MPRFRLTFIGPSYVYIIGCDKCPWVYVGLSQKPSQRINTHRLHLGTFRAEVIEMRECTHALECIAIITCVNRSEAAELERNLHAKQRSLGWACFFDHLMRLLVVVDD